MSEGALKDIFKRLREQIGLVENQPLTESVKLGAHRSEIMTCHVFRKFFATTIKGNGMDKTYSEIVMGHDIGLDKVYFKPAMQEVLEGNERMRGYISVIDELKIDEENKLRRKVESLTQNQDGFKKLEVKHQLEMKTLREEIENKLQQILARIDVTALK